MDTLIELLKNEPTAASTFGALASAIVACGALIVSVVSVAISIWAVRSERKHNALSVRPLAEISVVDYEDCIRVKLVNHGVGPMLIKGITVSDGKNSLPSLILWMPDLPGEREWNFFVGDIAGRALAPKSEIILVELTEDDEEEDFAACRDAVRSALAPLTAVVEYTDVFNKVMPNHTRSLAWFGRNVGQQASTIPVKAQVERRGGIDPAALAAASLASAVSTLAQSGPYTLVTSVLGITILLLVLAYDIDPHRSRSQSVAYSCVSGLTTLLAVGYPLELACAWLYLPGSGSTLPQWMHFVVWVVFSLAYFLYDKRARR
ncbi:MAG: hypothetical protein JNM01_11635 [Delftia acidovorans]|nr:hypothetical protein [Delftia acidovorans]